MFTADVSPISAFLSVLTACLVFGVLTLGDINAVFRRARADSRSVGVAEALRSLSKHMQALGNPDLQLVEFSGLNAADKVIANVPCKLFALYMKKPTASTVNAWLKGSDHATVTAVSGDIATFLVGTSGGGRSYCPIWHDGLPLAIGLTLGSHTTVLAGTKSAAADAPTGFAIIGAA